MNLNVISQKQIDEAFLDSSLDNWIIKPALPPLERDALYSAHLEAWDETYKYKNLLEYEILVVPNVFEKDKLQKRITLAFAVAVQIASDIKPMRWSTLAEWNVKLSDADPLKAEWPPADDVFLKKVAEIAKAARLPSSLSSALN